MPFIVDYKDEVKKLISETYEAADMISKEFDYTTESLTDNLKKIMPYNAVDEHLVYESLIELGFKPQESEPLKFSWYFKRKRSI